MYPDEQSPGNSSFRRPDYRIWLGLVALVFSLVALSMLWVAAGTRPVAAFQRETPTPSPTGTQIVAIGSDPDLTIVLPEVPSPTPTQGPVDLDNQVYQADAYTPTPTPQRMAADPTSTSTTQVGERGPVAVSTAASIQPINPDGQGSGLVITTLSCPEEVELDPGAWSTVELIRLCRDRIPGFEYEFLANGESIDRGATDERGQLRFERVPESDVELIPVPFGEYRGGLLSCKVSPDSSEWGEMRTTSLHSGRSSWELMWAPGVRECFTFVPYAFSPRIEVQTFWCPALDPFPQDVASAEAACQETGPGDITFFLDSTGVWGGPHQMHTPSGAPGASVEWGHLSILDNPHYVVEFNIAATGLDTVVWCREVSSISGSSPYVSHVPLQPQSAAWLELEAHTFRTWECKWFHYDPSSTNAANELAVGSPHPAAIQVRA